MPKPLPGHGPEPGRRLAMSSLDSSSACLQRRTRVPWVEGTPHGARPCWAGSGSDCLVWVVVAAAGAWVCFCRRRSCDRVPAGSDLAAAAQSASLGVVTERNVAGLKLAAAFAAAAAAGPSDSLTAAVASLDVAAEIWDDLAANLAYASATDCLPASCYESFYLVNPSRHHHLMNEGAWLWLGLPSGSAYSGMVYRRQGYALVNLLYCL